MDNQHQKKTYPNSYFEGYNWIYQGLGFGISMYVLVVFIFPLFEMDTTYTAQNKVEGLLIFIIGGLMYGLLMKYVLRLLQNDKAN